MSDGKVGNHLGGAAAALSDLERARRRTGADLRPQRRLHESAVDTFRDAGALLRALRTYEASHPQVEKFLDRLAETLAAHFRLAESLEVSLQPRALLGQQGVVFEAERVSDNPWHPLFKAGVRRLTLERGVTRDELASFFGLLVRLVDDGADGEDDAVTLLWAYDFAHIGFAAVDRFAAGAHLDDRGGRAEALDQALARYHRRDRPPTAQAAPSADDGLEWLRARNLSVLDRLPPSARAVSYRLLEVTAQDLAAFARSCRTDRTYVGRYFGALLGAYARRAQEPDGQRVLERLRELCLELISHRELRKAHQMLVHLEGATNSAPGVGAFLIPDGAVRHIVALMDEEPDGVLERDGLALLAAMPPDRAGVVIDAALQAHRSTLRAQLLELAVQWGMAAVDAAEHALSSAGLAHGDALRRLIRDVRAARLQRAGHEPAAPRSASETPAAGSTRAAGKPRAARAPARETDLPPFRGAPVDGVTFSTPGVTTYLHRPGRASRESVGPSLPPGPAPVVDEIDSLVADYVSDRSELDRDD